MPVLFVSAGTIAPQSICYFQFAPAFDKASAGRIRYSLFAIHCLLFTANLKKTARGTPDGLPIGNTEQKNYR
jgi:hypothetical protein